MATSEETLRLRDSARDESDFFSRRAAEARSKIRLIRQIRGFNLNHDPFEGQFLGIALIGVSGAQVLSDNVRLDIPPTFITFTEWISGYDEWSPNLTDWYACGSGPGGGVTVTFSPSTVGTTTTVTATVSGASDRIFLRAGVRQD